jgi:hypothetical protein
LVLLVGNDILAGKIYYTVSGLNQGDNFHGTLPLRGEGLDE